jgi:hypothetical protein
MRRLNKQGNLFLVHASLPFKTQEKTYTVPLIWDTGAALTLIDTKIIDYLGYSAREDGVQKSTLDGAGGRSEGYLIRVPRFRCLGFTLPEFALSCHDMDTKLGISGLLGMNFLEHFCIDVNYGSGEIHRMERISLPSNT